MLTLLTTHEVMEDKQSPGCLFLPQKFSCLAASSNFSFMIRLFTDLAQEGEVHIPSHFWKFIGKPSANISL